MTPSADPNTWLGVASISPDTPVEAGSLGTWTITYRVGRFGIDDTGSIKVLTRLVCDWGQAQLTNPQGADYTTVSTTGAARLRVHVDQYGGVRPWSRALVIQVYDGALAEGDLITIVWGDQHQGGPGSRAQTYPEDGFEFRIVVDCFGTGVYERLPTSPVVPVIAGPATQLVAICPSTVTVGQPVALALRALDRWGNPALSYRGVARFAGAEGLPRQYQFTAADGGVHRFVGVVFPQAGIHRVRVTDAAGLATYSNPVVASDAAPRYRLWWGDTQGQSGATVGTGAVEPFFRYARDVAGLDFVVHSGNDFQITNEHWAETKALTRAFHEPGRFVTFLSYEWSGNIPAGGDHNILFLGDDGPLHRSSHWQLADKSDEATDRYPIDQLWRTFRGRTDVMAVPHVGGRRANFDFCDPEFCHFIEISSVHGRFEWFAREALRRGLALGFVGATDDHSGRPGASYPTSRGGMPVMGGLAGVFATENTREALWAALRDRRCFATTGDRLYLKVTAADHWQGERFAATEAPAIQIEAAARLPIESLDILRGEEVVYTHPISAPGRRLRIVWRGARVDTRARHTRWDGGLTLSAGRIRGAATWGFDSPIEGIDLVTDQSVAWRSGTSGDPDGVTLHLDAPSDAEIHFKAGPADLRFTLAEVDAHGRLHWDFGGFEQQVAAYRVPDEPGPLSLSLAWRDPQPQPGLNAYWVRLVQADSHTAWSSPLYVDLPVATAESRPVA